MFDKCYRNIKFQINNLYQAKVSKNFDIFVQKLINISIKINLSKRGCYMHLVYQLKVLLYRFLISIA